MPRLDDASERLLDGGRKAESSVKRFWDGFCDFALQDNILEVAVGLIVAAAFTTVVKSFVSDIITPLLSLLPFISRNFDEKFAVLKRGPHYNRHSPGAGYNTVKLAQDDGAVVMTYGTFINEIFNFLGVGLALYAIALTYGWIASDSILDDSVKCKYCRKRISPKAQRCVNCTSWQDGREEH